MLKVYLYRYKYIEVFKASTKYAWPMKGNESYKIGNRKDKETVLLNYMGSDCVR